MNGEFKSGNLTLARYLARPAGRQGPLPGVILCHGFPIGPLDARQSAGTFPELIDRMANELGWAAMTFNFRGCGSSEGDFSLQGWVDDLRAAIDNLIVEATPTGIWLVGTNTGGSVVTPQNRALVSNFGSGNVSVVDTAGNSIITNIRVGNGPQGIALDSTGNLVVAEATRNRIFRLIP